MKVLSKFVLVAGLCAATTVSMAAYAPRVSATSSTACIDGGQRNNLSVAWNSADSVTVKAANNKLLCNDVPLYFSSYTMPDNYNGGGFSDNPTATPQTIFDSTSATLKKSTNGLTTMKVKLPDACKNIQVDLYYPPEIKLVTKAGHGTQYITGKMMQKTVDTCTPVTPPEEEKPEVPEVPTEEAQKPETPPAAVVVTPPAVTLPETGNEIALPLAISAVVAIAGYAVAQAISKRQ